MISAPFAHRVRLDPYLFLLGVFGQILSLLVADSFHSVKPLWINIEPGSFIMRVTVPKNSPERLNYWPKLLT